MTTETIQICAAVAVLLGAAATIVAAVITSRAAAKIQSRTETSKRLALIHQEKLTELNQSLSLAASLTQQQYSLKAQVLLDAYKLVGDVGYYIQRSIVTYTGHTPIPKQQFIQKAEEAFEVLMRYWWQNALFFPQGDAVSKSLADIMAGINTIRNIHNSTQLSEKQAGEYINVIRPALTIIREEFQAELKGQA